jgi:hypothetical protein
MKNRATANRPMVVPALQNGNNSRFAASAHAQMMYASFGKT